MIISFLVAGATLVASYQEPADTRNTYCVTSHASVFLQCAGASISHSELSEVSSIFLAMDKSSDNIVFYISE